MQLARWRGTTVAVKSVRQPPAPGAASPSEAPDAASAEDAAAQLRNESLLLPSLPHPFIIQFLGIAPGAPGQSDLLVLEALQGSLLGGGAPRRQLREAVELAMDLACAGAFLHSRGVVHLDIKPENCLLAADGRLKLADFGLARRLPQPAGGCQGAAAQGALSGLAGSFRYMAPEVFRAERYSFPADLYSFSMVAYLLFHGQEPFPALQAQAAAAAAAREPGGARPQLGTHGVPSPVRSVLQRCWAPQPEERPTFEWLLEQRLAPLHEKLFQHGRR